MITSLFHVTRGFKRLGLLLVSALAWAAPVYDPGTVDLGYGGPGAIDDTVTTAVVQPDERVVIAGNFTKLGAIARNRIARLDLNGAVDPGFDVAAGPNGVVYGLAVQTDGKILAGGEFGQAAGQPRLRIARFNANGALDLGFNPGAGPNSSVYTVLSQSDGMVVVGGAFNIFASQPRTYLARLQADGSLDPSFAPVLNGVVIALVRTPDGKFLVGGDFTLVNGQSRNRIVRLNADGSLDATFDPGSGANSSVRSLSLQPDGRIVLGGFFTELNGLVRSYLGRLLPTGLPDTTFAVSPDNVVYAARVMRDGRIVAGGEFSSIGGQASVRLARVRPDGTLDPTFKVGTGVNAAVTGLATTAGGDLIVSGNFSQVGPTPASRVAKVVATSQAAGGEIEFTAGVYQASETQPAATIQVRRNGTATAAVSVQYAASNGTANVADYTPQTGQLNFAAGETNKTFTIPLKTDTLYEESETVNLVLSAPTGGSVLGSRPTAVLSILDSNLPVTAGSRDPDFSATANGIVYAAAVQSDGQILIGGDFQTIGGESRQRLARLNFDGSLDDTFTPSTWANAAVYAVTVQADGNILVGGAFTVVNGSPQTRVARLSSTGALVPNSFPGTGPNGPVYTILESPDRTILVGGSFNSFSGESRTHLVRLLSDGNVDATFNAQLNGQVLSLARTADGKVLVGGDFTQGFGLVRNRILRLNADGSLDTSFDPAGGPNSTVRSVVALADGRSLIGGFFSAINGLDRFYVARLTSAGLPDVSFVPAAVDNVVYSVAVQPDGRILLGGEFSSVAGQPEGRLARLRSDGSRDASFTVTAGANASVLAVRSLDGGVFAAGSFTQFDGRSRDRIVQVLNSPVAAGGEIELSAGRYAVSEAQSSLTIQVRRNGSTATAASVNLVSANGTANIGDYTPVKELIKFGVGESVKNVVLVLKPDNNAELDETFNLTLSDPSAGAILGTYPTAVVTILSDDLPSGIGSRDATFDGTATGIVYATLIQPDGKLLVAGDFSAVSGVSRQRLARLNSDGSPDPAFSPVAFANSAIYALALQSDGKIILGGSFTIINGVSANRVARLNPDGTFDPSFFVGNGPNGVVYAAHSLPDDSVLVGGSYSVFNNESRPYLTLLLSDGSVETGFNAMVNSTIITLAATPSGQLVAGGDFTQFGGQTRNRIAQFGPDGTVDASFDPATGPNSSVRAIAMQPDGGILIGGSFTAVNTTNRAYLARLTPAGLPDPAFVPAVLDNVVYALARGSDGKIVLGGEFINAGNQKSTRIARLLPNGTIDPTFVTGTGFDAAVFAVRPQGDGQIVVGGAFNVFNGFPAPRLVRVVGAINERFRFTAIEPQGTGYRLSGLGAAGQRYALEASANLSTWTSLTTNPPSATTAIQFTDVNPPADLRYYRAVPR